MSASVGDWIIRGVNGEHYPCKPDIFSATYEEVSITKEFFTVLGNQTKQTDQYIKRMAVELDHAEKEAKRWKKLCEDFLHQRLPLTAFEECDNYSRVMTTLELKKQLDEALAQLKQCKRDVEHMRKALEFYANGDHLLLAEPDDWDTCSGEPVNFLHDAAGTASVEDGSIAKQALSTHPSQGCGVLNKQAEVKPLKAYSVQGNEYGTVVFARHGITARREGANELNIEFDEVESCRRAPELDCYAETGSVPWRILVEQHDWSQECGYCQRRVHNETLGRVWATDDQGCCSTECEARMENLTRKYAEQQHAEGE